MIKLNVNNGRIIEMTQEKADGNITVKTTASKSYNISAGDMVMLLNYYQFQKDHNEEIF